MSQDTASSSHPSLAELRAFNLGRLSDEEALTIGRHLDGCPACCRALRDLPAQDGFVGRVRAVADSADPGRWHGSVPRPPRRLRDYDSGTG
jgi:anti-sigma factor RsiW